MRNFILFTILLISGFVSAQTFNFNCTPDFSFVSSQEDVVLYYGDTLSIDVEWQSAKGSVLPQLLMGEETLYSGTEEYASQLSTTIEHLNPAEGLYTIAIKDFGPLSNTSDDVLLTQNFSVDIAGPGINEGTVPDSFTRGAEGNNIDLEIFTPFTEGVTVSFEKIDLDANGNEILASYALSTYVSITDFTGSIIRFAAHPYDITAVQSKFTITAQDDNGTNSFVKTVDWVGGDTLTADVDFDATDSYVRVHSSGGTSVLSNIDFVDGVYNHGNTNSATYGASGTFNVYTGPDAQEDAIFFRTNYAASGVYTLEPVNGDNNTVFRVDAVYQDNDIPISIQFTGPHWNEDSGRYIAYYGEVVTISVSTIAPIGSSYTYEWVENTGGNESNPTYTVLATGTSYATPVVEQTDPGNNAESALRVHTLRVTNQAGVSFFENAHVKYVVDPSIDPWDWYVDGNFQRNRVNGYYYSTRARFVGNDRDDMFTVYNPDGVQIFTSDWYDTSLEAVEAAEEYIETNFPD